MQSFRARSQLLISRLEDEDDVLHQTFSDDDEDGDDDDEEEEGKEQENVAQTDQGEAERFVSFPELLIPF